ncbi:MAG: hypothetical protein MUF84_11710 [Anaerolineae bacterium]|jgi:amino acid transporter|nr:hypothetical protein [Anaerolineae bacterium]
MALLEEPKVRDRVDQLLSFVLTLICVALAVYAVIQVRVVIALASELADFRRAQFRLATIFGVIVLSLAWFVYTLWVVDSHQQGYVLARIARAQGKTMPVRFTNQPVMPWLWQHNLHLAVTRFLKNVLVPLAILVVARIISEILQALIVGKP